MQDPDGAALASVSDPLERASGYLRTLLVCGPIRHSQHTKPRRLPPPNSPPNLLLPVAIQLHAPGDLKTHYYAFDIAMRKGKHLLARRADHTCAAGLSPGDAILAAQKRPRCVLAATAVGRY